MKSLMSLWRVMAEESAMICRTSADLDFKKVEVRVKSEGLSFLTITLPAFAKDFEQALDAGSVESDHFVGFSRRGGLPLFLGGFLSQVFDSDGALLENPSVDCIRAVRQLCMLFGKVEFPCSNTRIDSAIAGYLETEQELARAETSIPEELLPQFQRAARVLWADAFQCVDQSVYEGTLIPKHGPGATADKLRGNSKFNQREWTRRLEAYFPYGEFCFPDGNEALPSWSFYYQQQPPVLAEPGTERPVKVITVPKTLKTPRIIAVEPTCMQYAQQAISQRLVEVLEKGTCPHPHGGGHVFGNSGFVGFEMQEVNRLMAFEGSVNRSLATLDLSEASDRVLNRHVELLFSGFPHLNGAIQACRSLKADVPAHQGKSRKVITLRKFASMGSALCFPVEALVFTTIVFTAIAHELNVPLTREVVNSFRGKVRVYGDDIIIPVDYVQSVIRYLEAFGLKVNSDKSFWNGKFRESCGGDFYDGEWVTPLRVRRDIPRSLTDVQEVVSLFSFRNQCYWAGYWMTAKFIDEKWLIPLTRGDYNIVDVTAAGLGRESVFPYRQQGLSAKGDHTPVVRGLRVRYPIPASPLDGPGALLKFFLKQGEEPSHDEKHLERQGRPLVSGIKRGWVRAY